MSEDILSSVIATIIIPSSSCNSFIPFVIVVYEIMKFIKIIRWTDNLFNFKIFVLSPHDIVVIRPPYIFFWTNQCISPINTMTMV